jgi:hypothetical protein
MQYLYPNAADEPEPVTTVGLKSYSVTESSPVSGVLLPRMCARNCKQFALL